MRMVLADYTMSIKIPHQIENLLINIHSIETHIAVIEADQTGASKIQNWHTIAKYS